MRNCDPDGVAGILCNVLSQTEKNVSKFIVLQVAQVTVSHDSNIGE